MKNFPYLRKKETKPNDLGLEELEKHLEKAGMPESANLGWTLGKEMTVEGKPQDTPPPPQQRIGTSDGVVRAGPQVPDTKSASPKCPRNWGRGGFIIHFVLMT